MFDTPDTMPDAPNSGSNRKAQPAGLGNQVKLLPSPVAQPSGNSPSDHLRKKPGREVVTDLAIIVENGLLETGGRLLPTPAAADSTGGRVSTELGGVRESGAKRSITLATAVVRTELGMKANRRLLKTPTAQLAINGGSQHPDKRKAGGHGPTLADEVEHLLPTPRASDRATEASRASEGFGRQLGQQVREDLAGGSWGPYAAAIHRWEQVLGRPAPDPTELGPKGGRRLSAHFVAWMMGLSEGWVTDPVLGLSRIEQLRALGNGVVPQQALYALGLMNAAVSVVETSMVDGARNAGRMEF